MFFYLILWWGKIFFRGGYPPPEKNFAPPQYQVKNHTFLPLKNFGRQKFVSSGLTCKKWLFFFALCPQKYFAMHTTMPAAAGENFFDITTPDLPKMTLLSSFFLLKNPSQKTMPAVAGNFFAVEQLNILSNCLFLAPLFNKIFMILKSTMPAAAGENFF